MPPCNSPFLAHILIFKKSIDLVTKWLLANNICLIFPTIGPPRAPQLPRPPAGGGGGAGRDLPVVRGQGGEGPGHAGGGQGRDDRGRRRRRRSQQAAKVRADKVREIMMVVVGRRETICPKK